MTSHDPVVEADLHAYVDDQLDVARRIEVEAYLSERPDVAAKVMADLRVRDELRLALAGLQSANRMETREAARRLERSFLRHRSLDVFRRAAMIAMFVGAGWMAHSAFGPLGVSEVVASVPAPDFVHEAVKAHQTEALRRQMSSQIQSPTYDPADIRSATAIVLPELPGEWRVSDAQIFPSAFGPSVELAVEAEEGNRMSLFAVRPGTFAVQNVLMTQQGNTNAAFWQIGEVAYALIAETDDADALANTARKLARTLY